MFALLFAPLLDGLVGKFGKVGGRLLFDLGIVAVIALACLIGWWRLEAWKDRAIEAAKQAWVAEEKQKTDAESKRRQDEDAKTQAEAQAAADALAAEEQKNAQLQAQNDALSHQRDTVTCIDPAGSDRLLNSIGPH